jgi:CheY-like chemotaxis protein
LLKKWGIGVTVANNGKEALTLIQTKGFHLILMDLQMPEMDGYESTRHIRAFEDLYYKNIPIIAFSASSMINSRSKALAFGMTDFVNKPFFADELQDKIERYVTRTKGHFEKSLLPIDFDQHTAGDPAYRHELICLFIDNIQTLKHSLQVATSGNVPMSFLNTIQEISTTLEIIQNQDLNETIESLKDYYENGTSINLKEKLTLFYTLCDYMIKVLKDELIKYEGSPGSHSLQS